jgi:lipopolysaccharide transport system permease protein/teichoic acid transport system permease protein
LKKKISFLSELVKNRRLLFHLALRDFRIRYARNYFGLVWAVFEPLAMMLIMMVVFTYLRNRVHPEYPFIVYLLTGHMGYDFFSKSLGQATNSIKSYSFMIELIHIRKEFIPFISILTSFFTHLIVLAVAIVVLMLNGVTVSWYWLQLPYFMLAGWLLLLGVTWTTSALVVYVRDIQHVIPIIMRGMFFLTPIFWNISMFPDQYHKYIKLNPLYYLVEGYRSCLIYKQPFWSDTFSMLAFWSVTGIFLLIGWHTFKRLSPTFADIEN